MSASLTQPFQGTRAHRSRSPSTSQEERTLKFKAPQIIDESWTNATDENSTASSYAGEADFRLPIRKMSNVDPPVGLRRKISGTPESDLDSAYDTERTQIVRGNGVFEAIPPRMEDDESVAHVRTVSIEKIKVITSDLRLEIARIEENLRLAQTYVHNQSDEAHIMAADFQESEHLSQAQEKERRRLEERLKAEADELAEAEKVQRQQAALWQKMRDMQTRIHNLEEAREINSAARARLNTKREAFEVKVAHIAERQMNERKQLDDAQKRQDINTQMLLELEVKHLSHREQATILKTQRLDAEHFRVIQRKQAEQLRESQLMEQKHTQKEFELEFRTAEGRENLDADHKLEVLNILVSQKKELEEEQDRMAEQQQAIEAIQIKEMQRLQSMQLLAAQRRQARELGRLQKQQARIRQRARTAELQEQYSDFVKEQSETGSSRNDETSSHGKSQTTASSSNLSDSIVDEGQEADEQSAREALAERNRMKNSSEDAQKAMLEQQKVEASQRVEKNRDNITTMQRRQVRALEELRRQQKEEMSTYDKDSQKMMVELKNEQEEEYKNMRREHAEEMGQLQEMQAREKLTVRQADELERRLALELDKERQLSNRLLYQMLPKTVADELKLGRKIDPETFESVTIFFSDICGFTELASRSNPMQIVSLLNKLYTVFDSIVDRYDAYKVETIGDSYMIVSGLPIRNDNHAVVMADLAIELRSAATAIDVSDQETDKLSLRVGLHSGGVLAGVVGTKMPRYCLFGDTVNTASRMESTGEPLKIHVSPTSYALLADSYHFEERGTVEVKGKGAMATYWLIGRK
eukprot:Opistho-2@22044